MRFVARFLAAVVLGTLIVAGGQPTGAAAAPAEVELIVLGLHPAAAARKTVALTFDDGPSKYTPQVLDILKRYHVKATFCMLGQNAGTYRKAAQRIVREGHRLCDHSWNHPDFTDLSNSAARSQVVRAQNRISAVTGRTPKVFRFPYGASNARTRIVVRNQGLRILGWTVDTRDWSRPGAKTIENRAVTGTRPGAVILMHDGGGNRSQTVAALDDVIRRLKAKGYTFVLA
ncbi:hypothetical protein Acy02nite_55960 [Actinoplanes cyaneus]|uniref:NodB homology domain-containing protein n=1 Tax=Actinoplanes cyaneus TaxID=52696 RepID=A0A919M2X8_9ACTN|nr:polysaccharide deacetylase family protein [Actinoplanes cyaneus]MCW2139986.1 Peptidoglycan/xylan/chitin deacetylase, PgdA/CDA1 family [Actinoplanes cyaneus]GID67715.1 hypothetical protein Acy02nite_55960 [Actinoplanes cyaneus]